MSPLLQLLGRVALGALCLLLAGGAVGALLAYTRDRRRRPVDQGVQGKVCGHCGKILRVGRYPYITSACPPQDATCPRLP